MKKNVKIPAHLLLLGNAEEQALRLIKYLKMRDYVSPKEYGERIMLLPIGKRKHYQSKSTRHFYPNKY